MKYLGQLIILFFFSVNRPLEQRTGGQAASAALVHLDGVEFCLLAC